MTNYIQLEELYIFSGALELVHNVNLSLKTGEILALVGASGSGKTLTARAIMGLTKPYPGVTNCNLTISAEGKLFKPYAGICGPMSKNQQKTVEERFTQLRGQIIGYLPQDARGSLDPLLSIGKQVKEALKLDKKDSDPAIWLKKAGFPEPHRVLPLYPHQLSGGMAQRAGIALSMARGSEFIIADEPTTGLDPTVQEEILLELKNIAEKGAGILLITHDLRLVPRIANKAVIMHDGKVVESLEATKIHEAQSKEGRALLEATARVAGGLL